MGRGELRYEEAAEQRTVTGWACKTCGSFWPANQHRAEDHARHCCAKDLPCETEGCPNRCQQYGWATCDSCREKREAEGYAKRYAESAVNWDGKTPLYSEACDRYFFDVDAFDCYTDTHLDHPVTRDDVFGLRLVLCEPNNGRRFEMSEHLADDLPRDDGDLPADASEIDAAVNKWIEDHAPYSWSGAGTPVTIESVWAERESQ